MVDAITDEIIRPHRAYYVSLDPGPEVRCSWYYRQQMGDEGLLPWSFINTALRLIIMNKDEVKGKGKQMEGQIREGVGKLTGNKTEQAKGKVEQVEGKAQQEVGKIKKASK